MAASYKTPGVYLEEISKLPPSIASVETAIPCFYGVTEFAKESVKDDLLGVSKKINSLADYEVYYGFPDIAKAEVNISLNIPSQAKLSSAYINNMYYALKYYFDNGGGPCYIHSVGNYSRTGVDADKYKSELLKLDLVDEVTLVVMPDIVGLNDKAKIYDVYNAAMAKSSSLKDKFVIIDVQQEYTNQKVDIEKSKAGIRNVISNNEVECKYAAAYFPNQLTTYSYNFGLASIKMKFDTDVQNANESCKLLNDLKYEEAKVLFAINTTLQFLNDDYFKNISTLLFNNKVTEINRKVNEVLSFFTKAEQENLLVHANNVTTLLVTQAAVAAAATLDKFDLVDTSAKEREKFVKFIQDKIMALYTAMGVTIVGVDNSNFTKLNNTFLSKINPFFNSLFEARLKEAFLSISVNLPPSPAIAGVYANVDRNRGVWKAPANVSLNATLRPEVFLSDLDQQDFNVDSENGKSINCIRQFVGRGNLVWGARTLLGNSAEWKYINVRRFFNMVEESCENATRQFVFEPNDANTWVRVRGMIDNYLTNLWRAGALQGAKTEHAFYIAVGLNETMTSNDILDGILIVEIGLAVVRPAEFIVLRFSHKLAVS